jgi:hypothetical protein
MRILVLIVCLAFSAPLCAQKADQPFTGALEMGLGWGVPIDFTLDNNIFTRKFLGYRLLLALNCINFSLKYYKYLTYWKNRELYVFGGVAPVWIINVPFSSDLANNSIPEHYFRNWNLAVAGGLSLEKGKIRWKLDLDLAVVSVVNSEYTREVPEEERARGTKIYPFEVLLCCAYLIR